jgi:hypothetical protein
VSGPFETERQARAAAHAIAPPDDGWSILHAPQNRLLLERACKAAGVDLGAYDRRILDWLASLEDSICAVIAGLMSRAHQGGASQLAQVRLVLEAFDWETDDRQYALEQIEDIVNGADR